MYDLTAGLAALEPVRPAQRYLLAALRGRPAETDRFLGVFAGVTPIGEFRSPRNVLRLLGARGLARMAVAAAGEGIRGRAG
jgi:hypothetical protein